MSGVDDTLMDTNVSSEAEESDDHPFDEHEHDSDDEETRALMAKHNLMPGDRMRIERERKKRHLEQKRKEKIARAHKRDEMPDAIVHTEMNEDALKKIHDQYHADNFNHDDDPEAAMDQKKRAKVAREREKRNRKKNNQRRAVGHVDEEQLRKAALRKKKRAARNSSKPWEQQKKEKKSINSDADDEDDDEGIIDMTAHSARLISGRKEFKNKKVQRDIDRAAAQRRQLELREKYDSERKKLRSRELRSYIRNRYHKRIMKKLEKKAAKALKERPFDHTHLPSGARYLEQTATTDEILEKAHADYSDQLVSFV